MAGHRRLSTKRDVCVVLKGFVTGVKEGAIALPGSPFQFSANAADRFACRVIQIRIEVQTKVVVLLLVLVVAAAAAVLIVFFHYPADHQDDGAADHRDT